MEKKVCILDLRPCVANERNFSLIEKRRLALEKLRKENYCTLKKEKYTVRREALRPGSK